MSALFVVLLLTGGMIGWGAMLDRGTGGAGGAGDGIERLWRAAVFGFGVLGWLAFLPPLFQNVQATALAAVPILGLPGLILLRRSPDRPAFLSPAPTAWTWTLLALIAALTVGDVLEGLSPPADADSMAYHFATPKLFLEHGGLFFIPRASDGAAPLLPQMTYLLALGLGGERALTLWCMVTGWLAPLAAFGLARRHLDRDWALAAAAAVMSLPTLLYSAGTGQVEARTAAFTLLAAAAAASALAGGGLRQAAAAGLAAGFFMASKYTGLLMVASVGPLMLLGGPGRWGRVAVFGLAALTAGGQWYGWNWWNSGDPIYPLLFGRVPYRPGIPWDEAQNTYMKEMFFAGESILPRTLWWWLAYPVRVLVDGNTGTFEAGRTGFGPLPLVLAPFALAGAWRFRRRLTASPLAPMAAIAVIYYSLWFFLGTSQRIRHDVPVMPICVVVMIVAAERATRQRPSRQAVVAAIAGTLMLQLGAQGIVAINHVRRLLHGESRDAFLERNVPVYAVVRRINAELRPGEKVLTGQRGSIYLYTVPVFYAQAQVEPRIGVRLNNTDPAVFLRQMRQQQVTHILLGPSETPEVVPVAEDTITTNTAHLITAGCARLVATYRSPSPKVSRALMIASGDSERWHLVALAPPGCALDR